MLLVRIDDQKDRRVLDERNRREVLGQIQRRIGIDDLIGDDGQGRQEQRVAVLRRVGDIFGGDARAGAGLVVDDELLAEDRPRGLGEHAGDDVGGRARGEADHDVDRPRRIGGLRQGLWLEAKARERRQHGGSRRQMQKSATRQYHDVLPKFSFPQNGSRRNSDLLFRLLAGRKPPRRRSGPSTVSRRQSRNKATQPPKAAKDGGQAL